MSRLAMKECPDSEGGSWMWQPPSGGAHQFAAGVAPLESGAFSRRTFYDNYSTALGAKRTFRWRHGSPTQIDSHRAKNNGNHSVVYLTTGGSSNPLRKSPATRTGTATSTMTNSPRESLRKLKPPVTAR